MEPDEILESLNETATSAEVSTRRLIDAIRRAQAEGKIDLGGSVDALPVFLLGVVGGAVGVRVLKGALGFAVAAGAGWWAWSKLQEPSKKEMPAHVQPRKQPSLKMPQPLRVPPASSRSFS